jgi:predicted secreted protein
MNRCEKALRAAGFELIDTNVRESVITATYNTLTLAGSISVSFKQDGSQVRITAKATGREDSLYASFTNPSDELLAKFRKAFSEIKD